MDVKRQISVWKKELLAPKKNDVLVNLAPGKNAFELNTPTAFSRSISIDKNQLVNKLYKDHKISIKDSGTHIFGVCQNVISFQLEGTEYRSPLLLANCDIKKNRFKDNFEIIQLEEFYLNPLLVKLFDIEGDQSFETVLDIFEKTGLNYELDRAQWCANFHPHRFILVKELERIENQKSLSPPVRSLLINERDDEKLDLFEGELFHADEDQLKVFQQVLHENIVVQGPPGTGKSQVIANLMGKLLAKGQEGLLIAEKRVALDVIYDKLREKDLHYFCLLHHHQLNPKDFIASLKTTWRFLERYKNESRAYSRSSKLSLDGIDLTLQRIKQHDLIGGTSFSDCKEKLKNIKKSKINFYPTLPDIPQWKKEKPHIKKIQDSLVKNDISWTYLNSKNHSKPIEKISHELKRMREWIKTIDDRTLTINKIDFQMRKASIASLFFYDEILIPRSLFDKESKIQKRFLKLKNEFVGLQEDIELLKDEKKHWDKTFSLSELNDYINVLSSSSFFDLRSKFQRRKLLKYTSLNLTDALSTLENLVSLKKKEDQFNKVKQQLRKIGVDPDRGQVEHISYVIQSLNKVDTNLIQEVHHLNPAELEKYRRLSHVLSQLKDATYRLLNIDNETPIYPVVERITDNLETLAKFEKDFSVISDETRVIWRNTTDLQELESTIYYSHWQIFQGRFPQLANLENNTFMDRIKNTIASQKDEQKLLAESIKAKIQKKFNDFHSLLQTPARKLNEEQKLLKKELRKGKSILVKAFAKKRNLPSIHDLLSNEAKHWIAVLHPLFLSSPYSVAKSIPINKVFPMVIFDEASQIPINHAIGGLQRSERVVIAGDQEQMAPHSYFQKRSNKTHDLLHQASFYWKNLMLSKHYRSEHEKLISFSNRYFYNNALIPFPVSHCDEPIELINTNGKFIDRVNQKEAEIASRLIIDSLQSNQDIGIVAFSMSQLSAILNKLPGKIKEDILEDQYRGFVESLENVQGDQCDHLIISLGYAPNEKGEFHMRFGPLNEEQGHRRLNVLMSRAKKKITFIRSVNSDDFKISDNEGVEMLRKLMLFLEDENNDSKHDFPKGITASNEELTIDSPQEIFTSAISLVNYYNVMSNRGWKVKINL